MSAYHRPSTISEAVSLLRGSEPLAVLAGGTDIYPARSTRAAWGARETDGIVDISGIAALRGVEDRGDHWWIGATTPWADIIKTDLPPVFNGLKAAAREIGGVQIQNRGTIGGNICTASPAGDSIPCLMALDAEVECVERTAFRLPIERFFTGYRKTILDRDLVTGVRIPKQRGHSVFQKLGARRYLVISIAMVSIVADVDHSGTVRTVKIAVGACSATAQRLTALEDAMIGKLLTPETVRPKHLLALNPIDDIRASAHYRRHAALTLIRDAVEVLAAPMPREVAHD
jgi:CO/xanthine dehydrogenase FAD-binding subunit